MASLCCAYAKPGGGSCGARTSNPSEVTIRTAGEWCKDVKGHLRSVNCTDGSLIYNQNFCLREQVSYEAFFYNDKSPVGNDGLESSQAWQCIQPSWASLPYETAYIQDTT